MRNDSLVTINGKEAHRFPLLVSIISWFSRVDGGGWSKKGSVVALYDSLVRE